jgi:hypothetical protein
MYNLNAYVGNPNTKSAKIKQLNGKRDWMSAATYNCHPVVLANTLGYGIYFEEDVSFIWDGDPLHPAKAIKGSDYIWSGRPEGTISFNTNLVFTSDKNTSILTIQPPNYFIDGASVISSIISSSFFTGSFPVVWKLDKSNKEYFIPAGDLIACIIPISVAQFQDSNINIFNEMYPARRVHNESEYIDAIHDYVDKTGKQPKLYKKGIDHEGEVLGHHEVDKINMKVVYK